MSISSSELFNLKEIETATVIPFDRLNDGTIILNAEFTEPACSRVTAADALAFSILTGK